MILTWKNLKKIHFPIFKLESDNWWKQDGLVYLGNELLDDRNMPGNNLGLRRLQTPMKSLYPLKKGVFTINEMLKFKHFIDYSGNLISYEKTKYQNVRYFKINKVQLKDTCSLLWLKGVSYPFEIPRPPPPGSVYAGVLFLEETPWLIYDFSNVYRESIRRKI